eukprot:261413-Prymnesium_polylepis.1
MRAEPCDIGFRIPRGGLGYEVGVRIRVQDRVQSEGEAVGFREDDHPVPAQAWRGRDCHPDAIFELVLT